MTSVFILFAAAFPAHHGVSWTYISHGDIGWIYNLLWASGGRAMAAGCPQRHSIRSRRGQPVLVGTRSPL